MIADDIRTPANSPDTGGLRRKARLALARRDLLEFIRDRRTLFVTLLLPMAMYPILALSSALGVRTAISDIDSQAAATDLAVVLSGSRQDAHAFAERVRGLAEPEEARDRIGWPASIAFGFASPDEAEEAVEAGQADLWVAVPKQALDLLDGDGTLSIEARGSATKSLPPRVVEQFTAVVRRLAEDARRRRIDRAGLAKSLLDPVHIRFQGKKDAPGTISTRSILPTVAGGVFVLLSVLTMTGAFYPAIDAIAGEKERGTIETLLIAPCAAIDIVAGKFLAVWAVALATLVANIVSIALTTAVSLRFLPQGGTLLPEGHLPIVVGVSLLAFIGLSAVAAAMCLAVTTASKSGKEAQNTLTPVLLIASALAGAGLLTDPGKSLLLPAVPFAGQVALARATLEHEERPAVLRSATENTSAQQLPGNLPDRQQAGGIIERLALPLAVSLISSAVIVWLLLQVTATLLTDEEILFRGPDVAGGLMARPARRRRPSVAQGFSALAIGLAGIWYAQGIAPTDFALAIPVQQAAAVGLPLLLLLAWQRVDLSRTFSLRWPGAVGSGVVWRAVTSTVGGALAGAGLFVLGAAVLLSVRGTHVSAEAQSLAAKLIEMIRDKPLWLSWMLIALLPAIGEEFLFRGWVQSALLGDWPSRGRVVAGVVTQAACFAIFHLLPERMPQTFALGLAAGAMTVATRSLLPAIACHAAHNSMPLVMLWLAGGLSGAVESAPAAAATAMNLPSWTVAAALASVVAGTVMLGLAARSPGVAGRNGRKSRLLRALCLAGVVFVGCTSAAAGSEAAIEPTPKTQTANETVTAPASPQPLRVAVLPIAAAVEWAGDQPTGVVIDIWRELARRLGVETEFVRAATFKQLLEMLPAGEIDVALGPIAITQEREKIFDLTHPIFHSGFRIAVRRRDESGFLPAFRSLLSWQLVELLALLLLLVLASGHLLWWFERGDNPQSFPPQYPKGVWEAIWWIASTVVAGGCDNKHVATALGRAIAFTWMVGGIVLLAAFTSMLTATLTAEQVTGTIHGPRDLAGRTVGCQEMAVSVKIVRQRGGFPQEFSSLNDAFEAVTLGMVEAVLGENQQLMFLANQPSFKSMKLVGPMFESFDYGLGLPSGSPSRERFNMAILQMREDGSLDRIREQWLGSHD